MADYQFQVAVNLYTKELDEEILKWAYSKKVIPSLKGIQRFKREKVNYFAGYLFPQASSSNLEWIMKVFLWLFVFEELQEKSHPREFRVLLWVLMKKKRTQNPFLLEYMFDVWKELMEVSPGKQNDLWLSEWESNWHAFLQGIEWETNNRVNHRIPKLTDYRYYRPHLSGVFLALQFLKLDQRTDESCISDLLEFKIARWVCLSNDLLSAEKEKQDGDYHNELLILSESVPFGLALNYLELELTKLYRHIESIKSTISQQSLACRNWIESINLLMGGCIFWSNEITIRYESHINGILKT